ncbi:unnamed protein product [Chrysoparadoxa australica]
MGMALPCGAHHIHTLMDDDDPFPFLIKDVKCTKKCLDDLEVLREIAASCDISGREVDMACTPPGEAYKGKEEQRQHVKLRFGAILDAVLANEEGKHHWITGKDLGMEIYLCQSPIMDKDSPQKPTLGPLMEHIIIPPLLPEDRLRSVNLWLGVLATQTNMHYDCNHNLLHVMRGSKVVSLLPPRMAKRVEAMAVHSSSPNHADIAPEEGSILARREGWEVKLGPGDSLLIPEGYWHQVFSEPGTLAVNFWFTGVRGRALKAGPSLPYYMRCAFKALLDQRTACCGDDGQSLPSHQTGAGKKRKRERDNKSKDLDWEEVLAMSLSEMKALLTPLVADGSWPKEVEGMPPVVAYRLTELWGSWLQEGKEGAGALIEELTTPTQEGGSSPEEVLHRKCNEFRQGVAQEILADVLGWQPT